MYRKVLFFPIPKWSNIPGRPVRARWRWPVLMLVGTKTSASFLVDAGNTEETLTNFWNAVEPHL